MTFITPCTQLEKASAFFTSVFLATYTGNYQVVGYYCKRFFEPRCHERRTSSADFTGFTAYSDDSPRVTSPAIKLLHIIFVNCHT